MRAVLLVVIAIFASVGATARAAMPDLRALPATFETIDVESGRGGARHTLSAGRSLGPGVSVNSGSLVVERRRCLSDDHPYRRGDARVVALNPRSGAVRWSRDDATLVPVNDDLFFEPDRGALLVLDGGSDGSTGSVHALDARTGKELWSAAAAATQVLASDGGTLIVMDRGKNKIPAGGTSDEGEPRGVLDGFVPGDVPVEVRALDRMTGEVVWRSALADVGLTDPTFVRAGIGPDFVVITTTRQLPSAPPAVSYVLDRQSGALVHTLATGTSGASPAVVGDTVVAQYPFRAPTAFDAETGGVLWEGSPVSALGATPELLVATGATRPLSVFAIDPRSGTTRWTYPVTNFYSGMYATDDVLVLSVDRDLAGVRSDSGAELWRRDFPQARTEFDGVTLLNTSVAIGNHELIVARGCLTTGAD